jgi:hypothetical protein
MMNNKFGQTLNPPGSENLIKLELGLKKPREVGGSGRGERGRGGEGRGRGGGRRRGGGGGGGGRGRGGGGKEEREGRRGRGSSLLGVKFKPQPLLHVV